MAPPKKPRKEFACAYCLKKFEALGARKFCSQSCSTAFRNSQDSHERVCELCGKAFVGKANAKVCRELHTRTCVVCGEDFTIKPPLSRIPLTCSVRCGSELAREARESTNQVRYGGATPFHNEDVQRRATESWNAEYLPGGSGHERMRKRLLDTNRKRYGVDHASQSEEVRAKVLDTNMARRGAPTPFHCPEVQEQVKKTNLERYGVENQGQRTEIRESVRARNLELYGVEHNTQRPEVKAAIAATNLERYGGPAPACSPEVREKTARTCVDRYGATSVFGTDDFKRSSSARLTERYGVTNPTYIGMTNLDDWSDIGSWARRFFVDSARKPTVTDAIIHFFSSPSSVYTKIRADDLSDLFSMGVSALESRLRADLESRGLVHGVDFLTNDRTIIAPKELDFYFPSAAVAVEISPTWTHSSTEGHWFRTLPKNYHLDKALDAERAGVELITFFEWMDWGKMVNFLVQAVSPARKRLFARKVAARWIPGQSPEAKTVGSLVSGWHILGNTAQGLLGYVVLEHEGQVVGAMSFTRTRTANGGLGVEVELRRMVFAPGVTVVGGASKMLKTFLRAHHQVRSVVTFSDFDLGHGRVYAALGFRVTQEPTPGLNHAHPYKKRDGTQWRLRDSSLHMAGADRLLRNFPGYVPVGLECTCGPKNQDDSVLHPGAECLPGNREIVRSYGFLEVWDCGYRKWLLDVR